jgi:integrase
MSQKLTDRIARSLPAPERGNKIHYDGEVKGFGARITAAGAIAFIVNYRRKADGLERRYTIGAWPDWSVAGAREKAKELKRHIDNGGDPVGEHAAERGAPTVADLAARFLEEHVVKQRPHTQRDYRSMIQNDILPALGRMKVAAVEFEHVERLHAKITKRAPVRANRVLAVASKMFTLAIRWKFRSDNPVKGVERNREHLRKRYLSPEELKRFTAAVDTLSQDSADVIRMLLLTGARRGELLNATWDQFDLTAGTWSKPPTSTKQKEHHAIPLSAPARQLLAARLAKRDPICPWVFKGRQGRPREGIRHAFEAACKAADIAGVRVHDLRHSFASQLASGGASLPLIGSLLGHSVPQTTARYSHLFDDPQRAAVERVGAIVAGKPAAKVVPLSKGRRR